MVSIGLDRPDDAGQDAEHAGLRARRRQVGGRRLGDHVAVGRAVLRVEDGDHALEAEDRPVDDGDAELHRRVVHEEPGREVVGAVDDDVEAVEDLHHVVGTEADVVGDDVDVRVEQRERLLGRVDLALADAVDVVEDLALQVGVVDDVHVDDADRADAGRREVQGGRRAEAAGAEEQHLGLEQLLLALLADLGEQEVALVAVALLGRQRGRDLPVAVLVLPLVEAADHRHDVGVPELLEALRRERRAGAAGAVDDQRGVVVRDPTLDGGLQRSPGDVERIGKGALLVLVGLADVERDRARSLAELVRLGGVDLADLFLGRLEQVTEAGHVVPQSDGTLRGQRKTLPSDSTIRSSAGYSSWPRDPRTPQTTGRMSAIWPCSTASADESNAVGSALIVTTRAPARWAMSGTFAIG